MKILLVLPAADHLRVTSEHSSVPRRGMLRFSLLSLTMVAGATPAEHEVEICDENVECLDLASDADVVGVSFMTALANRAYEIARAFREQGKIVVAGGHHPTLFAEETLHHFNAVVRGDAEEAWPRLLRDVEGGRLERIYCNEKAFDLSRLSAARRDLLKKTAQHYVTTGAVQAGRGCSHRCRYCSIAAFHGQSYRQRPVERVIEEVRGLPREIIFVDDNLIADEAYARELFNALIPLKKRWVSQCSLKIADDPALLDLARRAGCKGMFIGIETTSAQNLDAVDKGFNDTRLHRKRIAAIRRSGIGVVAGMIVGMDRDDVTVFESTLRFLQETGIEALQLNIMTPLPGTPLYDDLDRCGRITDRDWSRYDFRHCVIRPARMAAEELQDGADWLYRQFYRFDRIVVRTIRTLFTAGLIPAVLTWRLNMTYRYDNLRESIKGRNPARKPKVSLSRRAAPVSPGLEAS